MRHGSAARRLRNRGGGGGGNPNHRRNGGNRNQVFDSNGPDVRIRGTAHQIQEKYATLAKDAASGGDRILAESYLQHAEHYQRVINSWIDQMGPQPSFDDYGADDEEDKGHDRRFDVRQPRPQQAQQPSTHLGLPASITGEPQSSMRQSELTEA